MAPPLATGCIPAALAQGGQPAREHGEDLQSGGPGGRLQPLLPFDVRRHSRGAGHRLLRLRRGGARTLHASAVRPLYASARYTQAPRARCRPFIGQVHGTVAGRKEIKAALEAFKRMFSFVNCRTVTLKAWALNTETGPYSETLVADADWDIGVRFLGTLPPRMGSSSQPLAAMRGELRSPLHPPCRCAELF